MKHLWSVGVCVLLALPAHAQPVTRMKAKLVAFDGKVMSLAIDTVSKEKPQLVAVTPDTRFVQSDHATLSDLKPGDWAGAAISEGRRGDLKASEVYVYAAALRGTGEGRFPDKDRLLVNGEVKQLDMGTNNAGGVLTLHYRGAVLSQAGKGRTVCEGRANPAPYASPLSCNADAVIAVAPGTPVSSLTVGDVSLLAPGVTVTVSMIKLPDGGAIAPGVIVEKPAPLPAPAEKPLEKPAPTP